MSLSYDVFTAAFLSKISEYEFFNMEEVNRTAVVDGYMKRAIAEFKKNCKYDLTTTANDHLRRFKVDIDPEDLDELVNIISEGMVLQWMKKYLYKQEMLENVLNTILVFGFGAIRFNNYLLNCWDSLRDITLQRDFETSGRDSLRS